MGGAKGSGPACRELSSVHGFDHSLIVAHPELSSVTLPSHRAMLNVAQICTLGFVLTLTVLSASLVNGQCTCPLSLSTNYTTGVVPDAVQDAVTSMHIDESTWEVVFTVHNVRSLVNGHVLAAAVDASSTADVVFPPIVADYNETLLWSPPACSLGDLDTPASSLQVEATFNTTNCIRSYSVRFPLLNASIAHPACLMFINGGNVTINCTIALTATRAYDGNETTSFLAATTIFSGQLVPSGLPEAVNNAVFGALTKCNVLNGPDFAIDCRVPGQWDFGDDFVVTEPNGENWINQSTCVHTQTTSDTYIFCELISVPVANYTVTTASISATVLPSNSTMSFGLTYVLPRRASAFASASLQTVIQGVSLSGGKMYYAGADMARVLIQTLSTDRLVITNLEFFNSATPVRKEYNLRSHNDFQLSEMRNATHFTIVFRPAAKRGDSAFYRDGPHGMNISFLFTAASNRAAPQQSGWLVIDSILIANDDPSPSWRSAPPTPPPLAADVGHTSLFIAIACGVLILVIASITIVIIVRRSGSAPKDNKNLSRQGSTLSRQASTLTLMRHGSRRGMDSTFTSRNASRCASPRGSIVKFTGFPDPRQNTEAPSSPRRNSNVSNTGSDEMMESVTEYPVPDLQIESILVSTEAPASAAMTTVEIDPPASAEGQDEAGANENPTEGSV